MLMGPHHLMQDLESRSFLFPIVSLKQVATSFAELSTSVPIEIILSMQDAARDVTRALAVGTHHDRHVMIMIQ